MTEWEPATEAEAAMRDALRMSDQELYFQILARVELLLPVSADALAGRTPMGWGTWNSGGRTHVLAFTSTEAMRICLAENAGSARNTSFRDLAGAWPNHEWWLAVNPGLPIEGYLPPWFVSQLARGDVRIPGRNQTGSRVSRPSSAPPAPEVQAPGVPAGGPAAAHTGNGTPRSGTSYTGSSYTGSSYTGSSYAGPSAAGSASPEPAAHPSAAFTPPAGPPPGPPTTGSFFGSSRPARASAAASESRYSGGFTPRNTVHSEPIEADEVLDADESRGAGGTPDPDGAARHGGAARAGGGRDNARRLRRYEAAVIDATVIDAEIIESTVIGVSAMEATIVDATVVDDRIDDADIIDATVVETTGELRADEMAREAARRRAAGGQPTGGAAGASARARVAAASAGARSSRGKNVAGAAGASGPAKPKPPFVPVNDVEKDLLAAATDGQTDRFLSTLLLAKVLIPIPTGESADVRPDSPAFPWRREVVDGQAYLVVFTSPERLREFMGDDVVTVTAKFVQVIRFWPDVNWAFAVNPGSPVGATLPGAQIKALAAWAADVGLTAEDPADDAPVEPPTPAAPPTSTIIMQKPIAPSQVDYYLDRGYDRASGFVHRATEVAHLHTPSEIYAALGLSYTGSPFERDATDIYVLRWAAHRGDLYRIPYGGQHEAGMRAMQGWMIERAPFRGNGFAPAENGEVIAEFKVDSVRLPHGAEMWRLSSTGDRKLVAILDADESAWRAALAIGISGEWDPSAPQPRQSNAVRVAEPRAAAPERSAPDPADDPLDPRWRGRPVRRSADWSTSTVGER